MLCLWRAARRRFWICSQGPVRSVTGDGKSENKHRFDLLHAAKLWKGAKTSLSVWIIRRQMFWVILAWEVLLFNTFPPGPTAAQLISKQLHGNLRTCQKPSAAEFSWTSWGQDRPQTPSLLFITGDLNVKLMELHETLRNDISCENTERCWETAEVWLKRPKWDCWRQIPEDKLKPKVAKT